MNAPAGSVLHAAVLRLLKPLVRLLLRHGVSCGAFIELVKRTYVELALSEFAIPGRKPSVSRAAIITGLTRKEVNRIAALAPLSDADVQDSYNRAVRVISGWVRDPSFHDAQGQPAPLALEGGRASFSELVRRYSGDIPVRAMLDELSRVGTVTRDAQDRVVLETAAYVPVQGEDEMVGILGSDVAALVATIDHNLREPKENSRLQLKVEYDNLPQEALSEFKMISSREAIALLRRFDQELASKDRDTNPASKGTGRMRAGVGIYYFEEPWNGDS